MGNGIDTSIGGPGGDNLFFTLPQNPLAPTDTFQFQNQLQQPPPNLMASASPQTQVTDVATPPVTPPVAPSSAPTTTPSTPQVESSNTPTPTLSQYSPAELAGARARGMIGANGLPIFLPGTVKFNSQGGAYNPMRVGPPSSDPSNLNLPGGTPSGPVHWDASAAAPSVPYWPANWEHPGQSTTTTTPTQQPPTTNQLTSPQPQQPQQPAGPLVSHLQLTPQPQPDSLQYQPGQQPPPGRQPTEVGQADPDATRYVQGTNIPIAVAKQLIRGFEPGAAGYRAAWGVKGGLPENVETDQYGFPTAKAYPGAPIGGAYGGAYPAGTMSHAAGMYQVEPKTWQTAVQGLAAEGITIKDFSPQSQEQVASWLLEHQGMSPWAGVGPSGVPFNANLKAAWEQYQQTGKLPTNLSSPGDYAGFHGGGPIYAGDTSGGYGVGGALAFAPRGPAGPTGGPAQNPEANPNAAGGPGGAPQVQLTPAEKAFQQSMRQQQSMRGYQMLALLAAMGKGHPVTSGYNPANAMPRLTLHETPMSGGAGYSPVPSVQTPGVQTLRRSYST